MTIQFEQDTSKGAEITQKEIQHSSDSSSVVLESTEEEITAFLDGSATAWLQVLGCFFVYFNTWGVINTFGTFETYYISVLPKTPSTIAWIGTMEGFALVVTGVVTGTLNDRGFFRALIFIGSVLVVLGLMMTSLCTEYWQIFLAQGICIGIGSSCLYFPSLAVTATYFGKNRAFATGVAAAGGQLAGVIYPIVFRQLIDRIGFGWTVRILAFLVLAGLAVTNAVHKPRPLPYPKKVLDTSALKDMPFLTFSLAMFIMFIGLYQPLYYTPTYGEVALGMAPGDAFYITAILNGSSIVGCIIPSFLGDRFGTINIIIPSALITSVLGFAWTSVHSVAALQTFVVFYGFFTGVLISLINPTLASLSPTLDRVGTRVGMGYTFAAFGLLIGSPLGGLLLDLKDADFVRTQVWGGAFMMGATVLFAITRWLQVC